MADVKMGLHNVCNTTKFDNRTVPILLLILVLLFSACAPILDMTASTPTMYASSSPSGMPILTDSAASEPTLTPTSVFTETATPHAPPTLTVTPTSIPTSTRPLLPAPEIPEVSSVISVENASQLTRLTSLGEGDLLNLQLSPDETRIIIGTSNGILIVDPFTFEKVNFLPTAMPTKEISFINGGSKITAKDERFGYVWTWPELQETWHGKFPIIEVKEPNNTSQLVPSEDFKFVFSEQHTFTWLNNYGNYQESYSDSLAGLLRTDDCSVQYLTDQKVRHFSSSPNDEYMALATDDNQLVLLQFEDGVVLKQTQDSGIKSLLFSPDGKSLIAVLVNQIQFWSIPDLNLINSINVYGTKKIVFSPDNFIIAVLSDDIIRVYRVQENSLINAFSGVSITFASDSKSFAIDNGKGQVSIYNILIDQSKAGLINTYLGSGIDESPYFPPTNAGVFSGDNSKLFVVKTTGKQYQDFLEKIIVYDVIDGIVLEIPFDPLKPHFEVKSPIWLPKLETYAMIVCNHDNNCHLAILDLEESTLKSYFNKDTYWGTYAALKFSRNGDLLISAQGNNFVYAWDINSNGYWKLPFKNSDFELRSHPNLSISFSPDDSSIHYIDPYSKQHLIRTSDFSITSLPNVERYFYPKEGFIGVTDGSNVRILNSNSKAEINSFPAINTSIDFNTEKKLLATVSKNGITVWDLSNIFNEKELFTATVAKKDYYYGDVNFSPNGVYVAAQDTQDYLYNKVSVWNSLEGSIIYQFGYGYGNNFAFSADSEMIAVSSAGAYGASLSILDLATGQPVFSTEGYFCEGDFPPKLAFSPDGKYLAVLCSYAFPQIWGIP